MNDDTDLLRRYAEEGSEAAFTELVRRHVDLVYGAALRRTGGDTHRAADVAQQVFTTLAREARKLSRHAVLGAWLHAATRNAALNLMISEERRKTRELAAQSLAPATAAPGESLDWDRLRPVLDSAIDELSETDRAAVVLRFLEQRPFAAVGAALRVSEDAARMRTDRALDKLRTALARRGITSTAAAVGALVSSQSLVSAPAGLGVALAAQSLATIGPGFVGATAATFMSIKLLLTTAATALVTFGAGAYFVLSRDFDAPPPPPLETPRHTQLIASLRQDNLSLRTEVDRLNARLAAQSAVPPPSARPAPVPAAASQHKVAAERRDQQQKILNNLRQIAAAIDQYKIEYSRPASSLDEIVGEKNYVRRLLPIDGENYSGISLVPGQSMTVTTVNGLSVTYDPVGPNTTKLEQTPEQIRADQLNQRMRPAINTAVEAYRAANNGKAPDTPEAIIAYFATPQEGADFVEFLEAQKATGRR